MIRIKKFSEDLPNFKQTERDDWVDLFSDSFCVTENDEDCIKEAFSVLQPCDEIDYNKGDILVVGLGVAIELPDNHEAQIRPRSSTFKNTGLLLTNSVGTIDESYRGDDDQWFAMFYATRDGKVSRFDRLLQFKVEEKMPRHKFNYVESFGNKSRGGYGTSGK